MAWVIQRTAPGDPPAYWGANGCWVLRAPIARLQDVMKPRPLPKLAAQYERWEVAFDVAEYLRLHQPMAFGEVIAVISTPAAETVA